MNGYRVEIGDIESAFLQLNYVSGAAVTPVEMPSGVSLVAHWTRSHQAQGRDLSIREDLTEILAPTMIPQHLIELAKLPALPNGKLDRKRMKDIATKYTTTKHSL